MASNKSATPDKKSSPSSMAAAESTPSRRATRVLAPALRPIKIARSDNDSDGDDRKAEPEAGLPQKKKRKTASSHTSSTKHVKSVTKSLFEPAQLEVGSDKEGNPVVAKISAQLLIIGATGPAYVKHGEIKFNEAYDKGSLESTKDYIKGLFKPRRGTESRVKIEEVHKRDERDVIIEQQARTIEELTVDNEEKQNAIDGMQMADEENERYIATLERQVRSLQADLAKSQQPADEAAASQDATSRPNDTSADDVQADLDGSQRLADVAVPYFALLSTVPGAQGIQVRPLNLRGESFEHRYVEVTTDHARAPMYNSLNSRVVWQDGKRYRETSMLIDASGPEGSKAIDSIVMARCANCRAESSKETLLKQMSPTTFVEHDCRIFAELVVLKELPDERRWIVAE